MKNNRTKHKMSALEIILRFLFGFLVPFVLINGLIFFLYIQYPTISTIGADDKDYENNKIKFTISCLLPITDVKTFLQDEELPYTKLGNVYIIDSSENGSYKITATCINGATSSVEVPLAALDNTAPIIDVENSRIVGNVLSVIITDNQSGINYDKIYAKLDNGQEVSPDYIDKSSGTMNFQIEGSKSIIIHAEDTTGNQSEVTFNVD